MGGRWGGRRTEGSLGQFPVFCAVHRIQHCGGRTAEWGWGEHPWACPILRTSGNFQDERHTEGKQRISILIKIPNVPALKSIFSQAQEQGWVPARITIRYQTSGTGGQILPFTQQLAFHLYRCNSRSHAPEGCYFPLYLQWPDGPASLPGHIANTRQFPQDQWVIRASAGLGRCRRRCHHQVPQRFFLFNQNWLR